MTVDLGLTHIALPVTDLDKSIEFYVAYAECRQSIVVLMPQQV